MIPSYHMFLFTVCQVGAESALKKEVAKNAPSLRFAYSRPGFLTFKNADEKDLPADFELKSIFARAYGLSIGKATRPSDALDAAGKLFGETGKKLRLHIWERDAFAFGDEPKDFTPGRASEAARTELKKSADYSKFFHEAERAEFGDPVLDLIYLDPDSWWIGFHQHNSQHSPFAGGKPPIELPQKAPSRAYLKLEESVLWSGAPLEKGDTAIEIGSAPGGASYALLERGLNVIGIDPADMDKAVLSFGSGRFKHIAKPAAQVQYKDLPLNVQWILLDMNVAPVIALNTVERIAPWYQETLLGVILTLKINEWKFTDEIPKLLKRVDKLGMVKIRARQLANNKQEICVVGISRKGVARAGSKGRG